jgi:hypothetical protein
MRHRGFALASAIVDQKYGRINHDEDLAGRSPHLTKGKSET